MKALHGGTATHDTLDAQKIAVWRRGGRLPQASVYPATRRATRDLLRRRTHVMRQRAELLAHLHKTNRQYHRPEIGPKIADKAPRHGVAERFAEPAGPQRIDGDLALIGHYDQRLRDVERSILKTAKQPNAQPLYLRRPAPGIGELLSLGLRDEIHHIARCPRVQDVLSSGRLVKCPKGSAGKRDGTSGTNIGHAPRTWAFSEAAVRLLRDTAVGQKQRTTLANHHGSGKALTRLAQKLGRAV